jgi:hypothetical protein
MRTNHGYEWADSDLIRYDRPGDRLGNEAREKPETRAERFLMPYRDLESSIQIFQKEQILCRCFGT